MRTRDNLGRSSAARVLIATLPLLLTVACSVNPRAGNGPSLGRPMQKGMASWYGPGYEGNMTASGEKYNPNAITAAHPSLPFNSKVKVVNLDNGKELIVRINDRGPFVQGRVIDLSRASAEQIGMLHAGLANVKVIFVQ